MMMNMTSLMLAQAIVPVAMVIFGYMLGSNQLPWRVLLVAFLVTGFLHPGKYEMRNVYWAGEESKPVTLATLPQFYWDWFAYGLEEVGSVAGIITGPKDDEGPTQCLRAVGQLAHVAAGAEEDAGRGALFQRRDLCADSAVAHSAVSG